MTKRNLFNELMQGVSEMADRREGRGMTDRELLEMAAKAAKIIGVFERDCIRVQAPGFGPHGHTCWRPLADDGDALRLGARFPQIDLNSIIVEALLALDDEPGRMAYIRRAIVIAVAEIGAAMAGEPEVSE